MVALPMVVIVNEGNAKGWQDEGSGTRNGDDDVGGAGGGGMDRERAAEVREPNETLSGRTRERRERTSTLPLPLICPVRIAKGR